MACPSLLISLLISFLFSSVSLATIVKLPLTQIPQTSTNTISQDPYENLINYASQSLSRAKNLRKNHHTTTTPLSSHSYGGYSISLSFGTPPQTLQFVFDTGSDLVWFPCTQKYLCRNCSFPGGNNVEPFIPKASSSVKILGCLNEKCGWIHHSNASQCKECRPGTKNCTEICPPYLIIYGSGSTGGLGVVETLNLPGNKKVQNVVVGCSVVSSRQPAGIVGFGRGPASLPSQLGLNKFSFCLLSRKFDDTATTTSLILDMGPQVSDGNPRNLTYTPFFKNPLIPNKHAFSVYYYLTLRKITIGTKKVKIPYNYLKPDSNGNGGTIIDSGSTFTYMTKNIYELLVSEVVAQTKGYKRAPAVELATGLGLCYNMEIMKTLDLPKMTWHFKGGAEMVLPLENYFIFAGETGAICLAMVTDDDENGGGPGIILGSFQMQNFYLEYDLRNERFGFTNQRC